MKIEFFGPPGSGKTTLAKTYSSENGFSLVMVDTHAARYGYDFLYVLSHPVKFFCLFFATLFHGLASWKLLEHKFHRLSWCLAVESKSVWVSRHGETVLIDEGLAQYFFSLYEHPVSLPILENYLEHFIQSDVLIFVMADETVRLKRMFDRGRIPRAHTYLDQSCWWRAVDVNASLITNWRGTITRRFLSLDTTAKDIALAVSELNDRIRPLL